MRGTYLAALEEGDYDAFPGDFWAQKFLRSYAQYLGLPPEELIWRAFPDAVDKDDGLTVVPPVSFRPPRQVATATRGFAPRGSAPRSATRRASRRWVPFIIAPILAVLVAAVVVVVVVIYTHTPPGLPPRPTHLPPGHHTSKAKGHGLGAKKAGSGANSTHTQKAASVHLVSKDPAAGTYVYRVSPGPLRVTLRLTQRCWVDATADGSQVAYAVDPAGTAATFQASRSFQVVLGHPEGASIKVNGIALPRWDGSVPVNVTLTAGGA